MLTAVIALFSFVACLSSPTFATAAPPEFLTRIGGETGSEAGQLKFLAGIAASPVDGHIFVADPGNGRVSEFTAWGNFVKAWGWGVADGSPELQTCGPGASPPTSTCQKGIEGTGPGQFEGAAGVAVDSHGDIYIMDMRVGSEGGEPVYNVRVQKFDPQGNFMLMFGGGVNQGPTHPGNLCTAMNLAEGDTCGAGGKGSGPGEFDLGSLGNLGDVIAVAPDDTIYVADKTRIQTFAVDGTVVSQFAGPESGLPAEAEGNNPGALDIDPTTGNIYFAFRQSSTLPAPQGIFKLSSSGSLLAAPFDVGKPSAIATDIDGSVFVSHFQYQRAEDGQVLGEEVVKFDPDGKPLIGLRSLFAQPASGFALRSLGSNSIGDLFVGYFGEGKAYVDVYGPPPVVFEEPPKVPPTITEQFAVSVDPDGAIVKAKVNPRFWTDAKLYVQYGTAECEASACAEQPSPPGTRLTSKPLGTPVTSPGIFLDDLQPETAYHYRFVAQSSGGGPVVGEYRSFVTPPMPRAPKVDCSNQAFRGEASAFLPDCRAYEMVSPVDKNNADVLALCNVLCDPTAFDQSAASGQRFTYGSWRAFGAVESAPYANQFLATRDPSGWSTEPISPPRSGESTASTINGRFETQYWGFSADLCYGWLIQDSKTRLDPAAPTDMPNLYRRDNCGGGYKVLVREKPLGSFGPELQGMTADGDCVLFRTPNKLTEDAASTNALQLYRSCNGDLQLVSIRPNGAASTRAVSAGTSGGEVDDGRSSNVTHAMSADGSVIYWTEAEEFTDSGRLYARILPAEETVTVANGGARFWLASSDGARAIWTAGGTLREFDLETRKSTVIAGGFRGVLGASEDASRLYFLSDEALADGSVAGKLNLYLYEEGTYEFIAALSQKDLESYESPIATRPLWRTSRVTPDGLHVTFTSTASLTGYDNLDAVNGEPASEVFLYDAAADELRCVSCLASGARPKGQELAIQKGRLPGPFAAAHIPGWTSQLYASRVLSDDGSRLFFESFDALVSRDTNGKQDVYQWEAAADEAACNAQGGELFLEKEGGCISLISSGKSAIDTDFVDASASGDDVFIRTGASLVPQDFGLIDIYDARVGGGFPQPRTVPACEGEACQGPFTPPNDPTPASSAYAGPGNPTSRPARKLKKRHKKHRRTNKHHRQASSERRAGR